MPPYESFEGFAAVSAFFGDLLGEENPGDWRLVMTRANGELAVGNYIPAWGETECSAAVLDLLKIRNNEVVDIVSFESEVFPMFGLPSVLPPDDPTHDD